MRALLDTHAFIWWLHEDPRLSVKARELIRNVENEILLSAVSGWEIAIKTRLLRQPPAGDVGAYVLAQIAANAFGILPLTLEHALRVASLPDHHRDPFDRALVAQAQAEDLPLLTADNLIARYAVKVIW